MQPVHLYSIPTEHTSSQCLTSPPRNHALQATGSGRLEARRLRVRCETGRSLIAPAQLDEVSVQRPLNGEVRVKGVDVPLALRVVHRRAFVEQLRVVFEREKGVPKAGWNPDLVVLDGVDLKGFPGAKSRTFMTQINHHIEGVAATRTSFPCGASHWKWTPRSTPRAETEWLS